MVLELITTVVTTVVNVDALQRPGCEYRRKTVRARRLLWARTLLRMGDHRLPTRIMSGELENEGRRGTGVEEEEEGNCMAGDRRVFGITRD